ncbi:hypothetical protein EIP86_011183 [Pleurotus ostreatoroseus]|nr:hypothetical protein EIP86_011183 [Pleurotus ostreatoroseus]
MSSPSSSTTSLSVTLHSPRASPGLSPPSTEPSTPGCDLQQVLFIVVHPASISFLKSLPVRKGSSDRVLLFTGSGTTRDLLAQAAQVVQDEEVFAIERWEEVSTIDNGNAVVYWRTLSDFSFNCSKGGSLRARDLCISAQEIAYSDALNLFTDAGYRAIISLPSPSDATLCLHVLERPAFSFPRLSQLHATPLNPNANPFTIPSLSCFREVWSAWDLVTAGMIPASMLHQKPIDLRHKPLFYMGHLPTFNALLLTRLLRMPMVEPRQYATIFERGIDPHVDDPDHCHNHSVVPEEDDEWPALGEVLAFRDRVRALIMKTLDELERGERASTRRLARTLMMIFEHEGWHIETILYMLIQRAGTGTLPPPGFAVPPWSMLAAQWNSVPPPDTPTVTLGPCQLTVGHDDAEPDDLLPHLEMDVADHEFGWDNESPQKSVQVGAFKIEWRPISNAAFLAFWRESGGVVPMPPSWVEDQGEIKVRTLYGPVSFEYAKHWPCLTAYNDLLLYARSKGGHIPTEYELRLFLDTYQVGYEEGANIGFRCWHPLPATAGMAHQGGKGSNGGVWEWTSTVLGTHRGFKGTNIFPGYSADFFDTKHQVVVGNALIVLVHRMLPYHVSVSGGQSGTSISTITLILG